MSATATRDVKTSNSANILMCKQWWKVCWLYGDQEKYYRQLYGRRKMPHTNNIHFDFKDTKRSGAQITELTDDFLDQNNIQMQTDIEPAPDENNSNQTDYTFGVESEPIYGFNEPQPNWQKDQRRQPLQKNYEDYITSTNLDDIWGASLNADSIKSMLENGLPLPLKTRTKHQPEILDSKEQIHKNGKTFGKTSRTICRTRKGAIVTEETDISTDGKTTANLKFQRSSVHTGPNKTKEVLVPVKEDKVLSNCLRRKCIGDQLTTTTTTLVTVSQTSVTSCNESALNPFDSDVEDIPSTQPASKKSSSKPKAPAAKKSKPRSSKASTAAAADTSKSLFGSDTESEAEAPPKKKSKSSRVFPDSDDEGDRTQPIRAAPLRSFLSRRTGSGYTFQKDLTKQGAYYVELTVTNSKDAERYGNQRYKHALITYKSTIDDDSDVWKVVTRAVTAAKADFKHIQPILYPSNVF